MVFKRVSIFLFLIFSIIPIHNTFAQGSNNVGFIPSNIWYSKDPFQEGDKIKIYTLVYNPDNRELSGTVIFFDNTVFLGKKDFKTSAKSVKDISIDWTATFGEHVIFAKIENARFLISKDKYEDVYLAENKTEESKRKVSKKIITDLPDSILNSIANSTPVSDVQELIKNNTPVFVTKILDNTINSLENIRTNADTSLENKKEAVKKEIDILNKTNSNPSDDSFEEETKVKFIKEKLNNAQNINNIIKPFKYIELFFLTIFLFIFKYKILFYSLLVIIVFLILRFIWRLIF